LPSSALPPLVLLPQNQGSTAAGPPPAIPVVNVRNQTVDAAFLPPPPGNGLSLVGGSGSPSVPEVARAPAPPTPSPSHPVDVHPTAEEEGAEEQARAVSAEPSSSVADAVFMRSGYVVADEDFGESGAAATPNPGEHGDGGSPRWLATAWLLGSLGAAEPRRPRE
jgi:hypothetical protein